MNVYVLWFTARSFRDLCATTQHALVMGLLEKSVHLALLNADATIPLEHNGLTHVSLQNSSRRGFHASSLGKQMVAWLNNQETLHPNTIAILDWRLAPHLISTLEKKHIRWVLMDRSPPADRGLFGRLQWRSWKKAWKLTKQFNRTGFVVSASHAAFVKQKIGSVNTVILPAGVDLDMFKPEQKKSRFTMVYHGRLDRHRGVLAAVMLLVKARQSGIDVQLTLIGEGDAVPVLKKYSHEVEGIELLGKLEQSEVASILGKCHVGLLTMPATKVWRLASPLKRSEYLAAGLQVLGIDHEGHRLPDGEEEWLHLFPQANFLEHALSFLEAASQHHDSAGERARAYAEQHLGWTTSTERLLYTLENESKTS